MTSIMRYRGCLEHFRKLFDRLRSLEQERDQAAEMLSALQEKVDANELELTLLGKAELRSPTLRDFRATQEEVQTIA